MMRFHALEFSDPGAIVTALGIRKGYSPNGVLLPPNAGSAPFTWEIDFLLSERQRGGSECPSFLDLFLNNFNSK